MARRGEHFGHKQRVAIIFALHSNVVDVPCVRTLAALRQGNAIRPYTARLVATVARGRTDGHCTVGFGPQVPILIVGHIKTMRRGFFKDIHPVAKHAPVLPRGGYGRLAFDNDKDHLAIVGNLRRGFTGAQLIK